MSPKTKSAIPAKTDVQKNLSAVETLNPSSDTRFFQKTVEDQNAKAARNAYKAA